MATIQIYYDTNGTVALYSDGVRQHVGDEDSVRRALVLALEIEEIHENYFMLGQETYAGVAFTTDDIRSFKIEENTERAAELRAQAQELLDEAAELMGEGE